MCGLHGLHVVTSAVTCYSWLHERWLQREWSVIQATGLQMLCTPQCSTVQTLFASCTVVASCVAAVVWYGVHSLAACCMQLSN